MAGALALIPHIAAAQRVDAPTPRSSAQVKERFLVSHFPDKPSLPPFATIPIDSLGFSAPGAIYLGARNTLVSLDFLDENHLLFTFRIPGLLHRDAASSSGSDEREIRAVVLALPQGTVQSEASWTVHDRDRYLWMLSGGHFLLRDRNNLFQSDASLVLKPFLDFPGPLLSIELDPSQQFLVTSSHEPAAAPPKEDPSTEPAASGASDDDSAAGEENHPPQLVLRVLHRKSGQVMLVTRIHTAIHLPVNSLGFLESLRGRESQWTVDLRYFTGGSKMLGNVDSTCEPRYDFLSEGEFLSTGCGQDGDTKLAAMTTEGRTLWIAGAPSTEVWPQLTVAANGSRLAWTTLDSTRSINSYSPMSADDIKEQSVTVFDAANGDIAFVSPVSPIFDVGGNVALSPSGRRIALINGGGIQVFDLPAPAPLPTEKQPTHP